MSASPAASAVLWTDLGNHGAIGRNCACRGQDEGAHLETNLVERQLKPIELLGLGDQHVTGTRRIMAPQRLDVTEMVVAGHWAECFTMAGHEADRLGALSKDAQRGVAEARGVCDVFHQHLAVTGLQHRRIVGMHADVARAPRLLVEIDGMERQQRMVACCDLNHIPCGERVGVAGVIEIGQRKRRSQLIDNIGELLRRSVQSLAGCVEMHVVAIEGDIGRNHHAQRAADNQRVGGPGRPPRSSAAQRQSDRECEQRQQGKRPGCEQQAV